MREKTESATRELYEADSELFCFTARVLDCVLWGEQGSYAVELDQTAFFPEGGGQYADVGVLDEAAVSDVRRKEGRIWHIVDRPLTVGATVCGRIDGELRMARMQNHTGEHIISGLVYAQYGYNNVGFHLGNGEMTLDFDRELDAEQLADIEAQANRVVWANVPVRAEYPDADALAKLEYRSKLSLTENVRIVTVQGVDVCACCAPHVKSTGEIGLIKIVSSARYKGGVRLWVLCGEWALKDYCQKHEDVLTITRRHSVKPWQMIEAVDKVEQELSQTLASLSLARRALCELKLERALPDRRGDLLFFEQEMDANTQKGMADAGADRCGGICGVFCSYEDGFRYVCVSRSKPLRILAKMFKERFGGGGGGSDAMIQGTVRATQEQIEALLATI